MRAFHRLIGIRALSSGSKGQEQSHLQMTCASFVIYSHPTVFLKLLYMRQPKKMASRLAQAAKLGAQLTAVGVGLMASSLIWSAGGSYVEAKYLKPEDSLEDIPSSEDFDASEPPWLMTRRLDDYIKPKDPE